MWKKMGLGLVLVMVLTCVLTGCFGKNNDTTQNDNTLEQTESQKQPEQTESQKQPEQSNLAPKYNVDGDGNVLNYFSTLTILYKSGDNYEIYTDEARMGFYYIVRDSNGDLLDRGYHSYRGSFDITSQNGLLMLDYGHGGNSWDERYYDIAGGRVSRFFHRPLASSDQLVAYFKRESDGTTKLIIQDIFEPSVYYKEILRDFSGDVYKTQFPAEFLDDGTKLRITYPVKDKAEPVEEVIVLD